MGKSRIKQLRKENRLTQVELADKLGVSVSTVAMWETGKRTPNFKTLNDMSDMFDRTIDYILGNSDDNRSVKFTDTEMEQLAEWQIQGELIDILRQYLALDEYGKSNVDSLIRRESLRCHDQGTAEYISNIKVGINFGKTETED